MFKKAIFSLAIAALVSGCSTFSDIDEGIEVMRGKPINDLIDVLGFPASQQTVAGRRFVTWSTSHTTSGVTAVPNFTGGPVTYAPTSNTYSCTIKVEIDEQDRILGHDLEGNIGGCQGYSRSIRNMS